MGKIKDWNELAREVVFKKYSRKIEQVVFELPDGSKVYFFVKSEGPAARGFGLMNEDAFSVDKPGVFLVEFQPKQM